MTLTQKLSQPYPLSTFNEAVKKNVFFSIFLTLFLLIFRPFGLDVYHYEESYLIAGYGLAIASLIIFVIVIVTQKTEEIKTTKMKKLATACLIALIAIAPSVQAQQNNVNDTTKKSKTILFPAISYAPETSVALGVSAVKLFAANGSKNVSFNVDTVL